MAYIVHTCEHVFVTIKKSSEDIPVPHKKCTRCGLRKYGGPPVREGGVRKGA